MYIHESLGRFCCCSWLRILSARLRSAGSSPLTLRNCSPDLLTNFNLYVRTLGYWQLALYVAPPHVFRHLEREHLFGVRPALECPYYQAAWRHYWNHLQFPWYSVMPAKRAGVLIYTALLYWWAKTVTGTGGFSLGHGHSKERIRKFRCHSKAHKDSSV